MGPAEEFGSRGRELAKRFLRTAVVVDDEAYMEADRSGGPEGVVVVPDRRALASSQEDQSPVSVRSKHTLDARSVIDSFSELGMICGVVSPIQSAMEVLRKADIVVLDWLLQEDNSQYTLKLLSGLLTAEVDRNSLRLVVIYTGEAQLEDICAEVIAELKKSGLKVENESKTEISYRHGRVVLYAKSNVNLAEPLKERSVAEEDLPERLVEDFSAMTEGLLPSIALTSLTAVREGEHRILDQFCADLDPAFLTHRACISNPDDAERQIVNHVSEELRGLMDSAVAAEFPPGADAVKSWIRCKSRGTEGFMLGGKKRTLEETLTLVTEGLEASVLKKSDFESLSADFSGSEAVDLDERLAWIMSFRTVFNAPPPTLWLGSVVTAMEDGNKGKHLICMRPRCDCVRLKEATSFFFLPLLEPRKEREQLVVRLGKQFKRLGIGLDPDGWVRQQFKPSEGKRSVIARERESDGGFEFTDTRGKRYMWQGELKTEYAQRIAQTFATTLSRVAVDESEWLRRMVRKG